MPRLRTDDGPRKLRAVWLGPAGHTVAFQWTYVQWLVTLVTVPVTAALGVGLLRLLGADWVWTVGIGGLWGGAAGLWLAVRMMRNVSFDEPLSYQRRLLRGEFSRSFSAASDPRPVAVAFDPPQFGYLSPAVCRVMGWDVPAQQPLPAVEAATARPGPAVAVAAPVGPAVPVASVRREPPPGYLAAARRVVELDHTLQPNPYLSLLRGSVATSAVATSAVADDGEPAGSVLVFPPARPPERPVDGPQDHQL